MTTTTLGDSSAAEGRRFLGIAAEGLPFTIIPLALAVPAFAVGWWPVGILTAALGAFSAFFFRDPSRTPPSGDHM